MEKTEPVICYALCVGNSAFRQRTTYIYVLCYMTTSANDTINYNSEGGIPEMLFGQREVGVDGLTEPPRHSSAHASYKVACFYLVCNANIQCRTFSGKLTFLTKLRLIQKYNLCLSLLLQHLWVNNCDGK